MTTVRALKSERGHHFLPGNKGLPADLALKLAATAGVVVNILVGCAAERADSIFGNRTGPALVRFDRFHSFSIT